MRTRVLLVSDRELKNRSTSQPTTKEQVHEYNSPFGEGSWEEEKGAERGGEAGAGRRNRKETRKQDRARTNADKTCHISKQDRVRHMQRRSMRTASEEEPEPPDGPLLPHPGEPSASRRRARALLPGATRVCLRLWEDLPLLGWGRWPDQRRQCSRCGPWFWGLPQQ